jgi:hypothetical protein
MATASGSKTRAPADKPLTVKHLKDLLRLVEIPFPARSKFADLRQLCEEQGIVARAPKREVKTTELPEFETVERITVVKCALRKAMQLGDDELSRRQPEYNTGTRPIGLGRSYSAMGDRACSARLGHAPLFILLLSSATSRDVGGSRGLRPRSEGG